MSDDGILCWFCPVCETMTLLERAERGECAVEPRRRDCPLASAKAPRTRHTASTGGAGGYYYLGRLVPRPRCAASWPRGQGRSGPTRGEEQRQDRCKGLRQHLAHGPDQARRVAGADRRPTGHHHPAASGNAEDGLGDHRHDDRGEEGKTPLERIERRALLRRWSRSARRRRSRLSERRYGLARGPPIAAPGLGMRLAGTPEAQRVAVPGGGLGRRERRDVGPE